MSESLKHSSDSKDEQRDSVSQEKGSEPDIHAFTLRVYADVIVQVDAAVSKHPVIRNRNTWIVNAIVEQLKREGEG